MFITLHVPSPALTVKSGLDTTGRALCLKVVLPVTILGVSFIENKLMYLDGQRNYIYQRSKGMEWAKR